jgi:polysaccharide chain length determinant protein (PEP-CTERM system associated)
METRGNMEQFISQLLASARGIWHYRWHAVLATWAMALAGWMRVLSLPDEYQSTARVYVDTQSMLKPLLAGMTSVPNVGQQVAIMSRTLLSRPNIERVMRTVDLDVRNSTAREHEERVEALMAKIRISSTGTYDIYTISYHDRDPKLVRDVVQALLTIFVEGSYKGKKGDAEKAVQFIDEQIKAYEERLAAAESQLKDFKLKNSGLLPRQGIDYSAQMAMAQDALNTARLDLREAERARAAIRAQVTGDAPVPLAQRPVSAIVNPDLDVRIAAVNKNLDNLLMQYTDQHPDIIAARRLLARLEARKLEEARLRGTDDDPGKHYSPMLQQLKVALTEADAKVAALHARVEEYTARHARLQASSRAVPVIEQQLAQMNRDYEINKENYEKLVGRRDAARLSDELSASTDLLSFRIIDPPSLPVAPTGPRRALFYSLVLLLAVIGGPSAALLLSRARPTFLGPAMMRELTGLPVLGTVSMNWTAQDLRRRRRGQLLLGAALGGLALVYLAIMASAWFKL